MQSLSFFIVLIILIKTNFLSSAIVQPTLQAEENIYSINARENLLIATAGAIFVNNPYFCNSFAIPNLAYLPTLPLYSQLATPIYQKICCNTTDITGTIGINIPLNRIGADEKRLLNKIPICSWETIRSNSPLKYKKIY